MTLMWVFVLNGRWMEMAWRKPWGRREILVLLLLLRDWPEGDWPEGDYYYYYYYYYY